MPEQYSRRERNLSGAEAAAGAAIGVTAASNRVPDIVNSWARRGRKAEYESIKHHLAGNDQPRDRTGKSPDLTKGKGWDEAGKKFVHLKALPEDTFKPTTNTNPKTGETFPGKPERVSPRADAFSAAWKKHDEAKNVLENKTNVPFPDEKWHYNAKGKKLKKIVAKDPKTKTAITNKAGKIKMIKQPASLGYRRRSAVLAVGIPVGVGLAWHGARNLAHQNELKNKVSKTFTRGQTDAAVVGGTIGGVLYQAPSFTEWGQRGGEDKKLLKKKKTRAIVNRWKDEYDLHGAQGGDHKRWTRAYRNFPKKLPGAEMRRVQAYTHAGGSGVALNAAAIGAGALIGAKAVKARNNRRARG